MARKLQWFAAPMVVVWAVLAGGCGGNEGLVVNNPWDPDYAEYFDDSVDFTMNPESLSGQWLYDYRLELESRVSLADFILAVRIDSINHKTDSVGKEWKNLGVNIEKTVKGEFPGKSVVLTVADDQPGYDSFKIEDARLMDKVYVAFLRLYETEDGTVGIHWHLSPLSQGLMKGMDEILGTKKKKNNKDEKVYTLETS